MERGRVVVGVVILDGGAVAFAELANDLMVVRREKGRVRFPPKLLSLSAK